MLCKNIYIYIYNDIYLSAVHALYSQATTPVRHASAHPAALLVLALGMLTAAALLVLVLGMLTAALKVNFKSSGCTWRSLPLCSPLLRP